MLNKLNPQQLEAATIQGSALVLAGAGSGKTRVLTSRIGWLLDKGVEPGSILAVTFTNKAAGEMKERIQETAKVDTDEMWMGTFHGLSYRIIRENLEACGLKGRPTILDEDDQRAILKRIMKRLEIDMDGEDGLKPAEVGRQIALWKDAGLRPHSAEGEPKIVRIFEEYETECRKENVLDFADLILTTVEMLEMRPDIRQAYADKFTNILIDEFQDTNDLQFRWLGLMRNEKASVLAVGDDDQSIYGFRGANPTNMHVFLNQMANGNIIKLEENYRSTKPILSLANAIIENNDARLGKSLWTKRDQGDMPVIRRFEDDDKEARYIVSDIEKRLSEGVKPSQIAVIYRTNAQSRLFEKFMVARGIPHKVFGGYRFYERKEIRAVLGYLQLLANPENDTAFLRVVNFPTRGLADKAMDWLENFKRDNGYNSYMEAALAARGMGTKFDAFVDLMFELDRLSQFKMSDLISGAVNLTGIKKVFEKDKNEIDRVQNLESLVSAAVEIDREHGEKPAIEILEDFLATTTLDRPVKAEDAVVQEDHGNVSLMTVHTAKGLEFDTVYVAGAEQGVFPHSMSMNDNGGIEEERRLMYVAFTRPERELVISYSLRRMINGQYKNTGISDFLKDDVPADELTRFADHAPHLKNVPRYGEEEKEQKYPRKPAPSSSKPSPIKKLFR